MRISFILPRYYPQPIGGYRIVYQHANALAERGHEVTVVLPRHLAGREALSPVARAKAWAWPAFIRLRQRPLVDWQPIHPAVRLALAGVLSGDGVPDGDAVIATAWQTAPFVARLPPAKGRKLYLVQDYETWEGADPREVDETFRLPLRIIAISRWLAAMAAEKGAGDVVYVPNAIDHDLFRVTGADPQSRPPSILALSHVEPRKDTPLAVAALTALHQRHPETPITMFGAAARPAFLPDWIVYRQKPVQQELAALYNAHSVYLSSSRKEGWALPPAEAMACGCAFVGTDSSGPRDFAEDGRSALLSPPGDAPALVANLLRVVEDEALRRRLQVAGQASIANFTWARSGDLMEAALQPPH